MRGSREGDRGSGPPPPPHLKNHKNIGLLSTTGPDPLKITKLLIKPVSMLGHHPHTSETPFNLYPSSTKKQKHNKKKTLLKLTPYDKTFRIRACHTSSADRGLLELFRLSTVLSITRKVDRPMPPSIQVTHT